MNWKRWLVVGGLIFIPIVFAATNDNSKTNLERLNSTQTIERQNSVVPAATTPPIVRTEPEVTQPKPVPVAPSYALNGTYENVYGNQVPSPYYNDTVPAGASALCRDGTYSFSQSRRGTCSHHGGVEEWL